MGQTDDKLDHCYVAEGQQTAFLSLFRAFLSLFRPNIEQKTPVDSSFSKLEQNKQHHRTPSKKIHNPRGFKIVSTSYKADAMSKNAF